MLVNSSFESTPSQVIKQSFGFRGELMPSWGTRFRQWWHKDCRGQPLSPPLLFGSFLNMVTIVLNPSPDGFLWTKWWNYETTCWWTCMAVPPRRKKTSTVPALVFPLFGAWLDKWMWLCEGPTYSSALLVLCFFFANKWYSCAMNYESKYGLQRWNQDKKKWRKCPQER